MEKQPKRYEFPWKQDDDVYYLKLKAGDSVILMHPYNTIMFLYPEYPEADHIWIHMGDNSDGTMQGIRLWRENIDALGDGAFGQLCDEMFEREFDLAEDEEPSPLDRQAYEETFGRQVEKDLGSIVLKAMTNFEQAWEYYSEEWG